MEALRQIVRIPRDHELKIRVPQNIPENETVEVILIIKERQKNFKQRIKELKCASKDNIFLEDLQEISRDFEPVDSEGW
ncbi:MAG: hypothetical protein D4R88_02800 [Methanosarcinales archaeon]|nr:MAG: hypothetical protein D4R88_02800 [Methanosarcinales archaeon]